MDFYLISVILFFIFAIGYIGYRIYKKNHFEEFGNQYEFLSYQDAYKIILDSGYFEDFNTANLRARLCANVSNCKMKYKKELMRIDPMEADAIKWLVDIIIERLKEHRVNVGIFNMTLKFAKFSSNLEGNMPHTHQDVIFLPSSFYEKVWKYWQQSKNKSEEIDNVIVDCGGTLIHEICHVLQRKYEYYFHRFYKNRWHFQQIDIKSLTKCENILEINRLNPDGRDVNWVWKNPYLAKNKKDEFYLLLAVFKDNHPKFLGDVINTVYILNKYTDDKYNVNSIGTIEENQNLRQFFGPIGNNYHPNEISAEYLSIYLLEKMNLNPSTHLNVSNSAYHEFINFVEALI
jgi:hypothetical protein